MIILVPWKPVALVLGLLATLIFVSYFGSALVHGNDPFAVSTGTWQHTTAQQDANSPIPSTWYAWSLPGRATVPIQSKVCLPD
jgi:hypothetical protein